MSFRLGLGRAVVSFLGFVILFGAFGCKSTPSPIIVGDTYTNIEYEYSLKIPRGWEPIEALPDRVGFFRTLADTDRCSLLLYNQESGGLIAIMNNTNRIAYEKYFDISFEQWDKIILKLKGSFEEDLQDLVFTHAVHTENLYTTQQNYFVNQYAYKPEKIYRVETSFALDGQRAHLNFDSFLFPCRNSQSCETIIILTCLDSNLTQNEGDYKDVLLSLRAHDYYD